MNRINDFWKPFYFRWVETFLDKGCGEELVPLKHFLHRFTRSIFWEIEDMIPLFVPPPLLLLAHSSLRRPAALLRCAANVCGSASLFVHGR